MAGCLSVCTYLSFQWRFSLGFNGIFCTCWKEEGGLLCGTGTVDERVYAADFFRRGLLASGFPLGRGGGCLLVLVCWYCCRAGAPSYFPGGSCCQASVVSSNPSTVVAFTRRTNAMVVLPGQGKASTSVGSSELPTTMWLFSSTSCATKPLDSAPLDWIPPFLLCLHTTSQGWLAACATPPTSARSTAYAVLHLPYQSSSMQFFFGRWHEGENRSCRIPSRTRSVSH